MCLDPITLDSVADAGDDMAKMMGFAGFDTTKNKKVTFVCYPFFNCL